MSWTCLLAVVEYTEHRVRFRRRSVANLGDDLTDHPVHEPG